MDIAHGKHHLTIYFHFALGLLSNPIFLCVPSQNGLFEEFPHLQREKLFFV